MQSAELASPLELWGGVECTVNRVGDAFFDQVERSGHAQRPDDLARFAELGIRTLRYPILWERTAPDGLAGADWSWADDRLGRLRALGIRPIVGLVHHGSGPRRTNLLEPGFAEGLAEYAEAVARRYPWVEFFTPVNEPLTTARFSALYGFWYPHARDPLAFARAVLSQCRAVALAMARIRAVTPGARLVQTEDLGKVFSSRTLTYQADFENERRWLSFDLLTGRVAPGHPMWDYLLWLGVSRGELDWFRDHPCPPDVMGVNYYLTSERYLDERRERYPPSTHGGNGRHAYADVEAVRVRPEGMAGPRALLGEVWERFRLPLAVTEVHNGCTREEQMRWLLEVWDAADDLRRAGADVRAVTLWALLGTYDWNSLVTVPAGHYEPGPFDLRAPEPRPTGLAAMARKLAAGRRPKHPVLDTPGWWRRSKRFGYGRRPPRPSVPARVERRLLIAGATGTLGQAFAQHCELRGIAHALLSREEMDIADPAAVEAALTAYGAWAVLNAAGYVRVDDAEREPERCFRENVEGPETLARACRRRGVRLVTFSSDLVFDGRQRTPYDEGAEPRPLNVYGRSKAEMERRVLSRHPGALVVRTSAFFGPWDEYNFVTLALRGLATGRGCVAADDVVVSPTYVPDLVDATLDLLIDGEYGIWHLANAGAVTWAELARRAAELAGLDPAGVEGCPSSALGLAAPRPAYSVLGSRRAWILPPLDHALVRYVNACEGRWGPASGDGEAEVEGVLEA